MNNFSLSKDQREALERFKTFLIDDTDIFILKGYAGTGKTTLVKYFIEEVNKQQGWKIYLLASTGRAAKILESRTGIPAGTLHGHIYTFAVEDVAEDAQSDEEFGSQLSLNFSLKALGAFEKCLFIVDEASMLSHLENNQNKFVKFGSGNVLGDLFRFAQEQKIVFVGDPVQLPPPIGENPFSSALHAHFIRSEFGLKALEIEMTHILRQDENHSILDLATHLRNRVRLKEYSDWEGLMNEPRKYFYTQYTYQKLIDKYLEIAGENWDQSVIIVHTNNQAFYYNDMVRKTIHKTEPPKHLQMGDLLMVAQNSYIVPLANGDQVIVRSVKPSGKKAGFLFLEVELESIADNSIHRTLMLHEFLFRPESNLDPEKQRLLMMDYDYRARRAGLKRNSDTYMEGMRSDPYLNALRAKFGYAITCHKAQGGEWPIVCISLSESLDLLDDETKYRWLYTAVTRAKRTINLKPIYRQKPKMRRIF